MQSTQSQCVCVFVCVNKRWLFDPACQVLWCKPLLTNISTWHLITFQTWKVILILCTYAHRIQQSNQMWFNPIWAKCQTKLNFNHVLSLFFCWPKLSCHAGLRPCYSFFFFLHHDEVLVHHRKVPISWERSSEYGANHFFSLLGWCQSRESLALWKIFAKNGSGSGRNWLISELWPTRFSLHFKVFLLLTGPADMSRLEHCVIILAGIDIGSRPSLCLLFQNFFFLFTKKSQK